MAVREFNGTSDQLVCAIGGLSGMTYGTAAALVKLNSATVFNAIGYLHGASNTFISAPLYVVDFGAWAMNSTSDSTGSTATTARWYLAVCRKATGSATPRFSVYDYSTAAWTHTAGSIALADWTSPGTSGTVQFSYQAGAGDFFNGRVAARGYWSNSLPWTADASGDSAVQSAGLHTAASSWASANPSAWWLFNQASTATSVPDLSSTGTANQTSLTGTTVVTGDDPPGFDFTLAAAGPQPVALQSAQPWPAF